MCLDGWKGSLYIIQFSLCYVHVFTISSWMLKHFIDLKNVFSPLIIFWGFLFFFWVGTCSVVVCQPWSSLLCSIAAYSGQSVLDKIKDKPCKTVEECRKQCHVDFQLETCHAKEHSKISSKATQPLLNLNYLWSYFPQTISTSCLTVQTLDSAPWVGSARRPPF